MMREEPEVEGVRGERETAVVQAPSMQARLSNILAIGLMSVLGLAMLTWYYANAMTRQSRARQSAQAVAATHVQGDMPLPSLGKIDPPPAMPAMPPPAADRWPSAADEPAQRAAPLMATPLREIPLATSQSNLGYAAPPVKTPAQLALERQLSGAVFAPQSSLAASAPSGGLQGVMPLAVPPGAGPPGAGPPGAMPQGAAAASEPGELGTLLRPSVTTAVHAQLLPTQRLLLPKGAFLDCTLETAIDSTLPGMTTCIMATDTFGVDGNVVLLERGTKLVGETRGQVQQGAARVFVLWNEARTPTGVIVPLASPGADELGRSGLPGTVERHFWERFGAALLVSVIDGAVQAAVLSSRSNSGAVIVNPSATQDVMTEVLKGTINISPTVLKRQGDRIQVLVARDLDFRSVYELKSAAAGR